MRTKYSVESAESRKFDLRQGPSSRDLIDLAATGASS
jgi:hypothetical protein